jgi:arylsulfatase A-like enzyme
MKGGDAAKWVDIDMADHFLQKAKNFVNKWTDSSQPFFLYYSLQQPHVPRTPHPRFEGKSGMGPRGDAILEADWVVGEFFNYLEEKGILENTLIILSSDNGPVLNDGYYDEAVEKIGNHTPSGPLRGGKYSLFEAGTRVPFAFYWKGKIEPMTSEALVSQLDLMASLGALVGSKNFGQDSENLLDAFLGKVESGRKNLIIEATGRTAFREENWVMIPPYEGPEIQNQVNIELANSPEYQLYDLAEDLSQKNNLAKTNPDKLKELIKGYEQLRGVDPMGSDPLHLK